MKPFIFQLPITKNELVGESKIEFSTSQINSQPLFKYGFHHYINQTKDKLVILDKDDLKGKNFYNIIENFNDVVPNYDDSISNINKKYLAKDVKNNQLELWEILSIFGFEGTMYINDEDYDDMIKMFYNKTGLKYKAVDSPSKADTYININSVMGNIKFLEQTQYSNLIEAICEIGEGLNKKGNCVIRIYDSFTDVTVKLIKLVSEMFEETYMYKPYMTYARDSTKYIIGMNFKDNFKNSKQLRELLKPENKLNSIYNNHTIPENFEFVMKYINVVLGNYEHKMVNTLVEYIKKSNYFGDIYHNSLEHQKETSKFWIETFYPKSPKDYKKTKDNLINIVQMTIKENNKNMNEMFKVLI